MTSKINLIFLLSVVIATTFILFFHRTSFAADCCSIKFFGRYYDCTVEVKEYNWFAKIMNIFGEINKTWGKIKVKYKIGGLTENPIQLESKWLDGYYSDLDEHIFICNSKADKGYFDCENITDNSPFNGDEFEIQIPGGSDEAKFKACKKILNKWEDGMSSMDIINIKKINIE